MQSPIKATEPQPKAAAQTQSERWSAMMVAAQNGNGGAYHRLLTEVGQWLRRYYARRLPPGQVDDAVQEALIAIHTKRHTFESGRPFAPWLAGIARYKWIDRLRAMSRQPICALDANLAVGDHEADVTSAHLLGELLGHLRPAQATAIRLVKLKGLSVAEASAATGQSQSLIKVNVHRGLAKLALIAAGREAA